MFNKHKKLILGIGIPVLIIGLIVSIGALSKSRSNKEQSEQNYAKKDEVKQNTPTQVLTPTVTPLPEIKTVKVRALYLTSWAAGESSNIDRIIGLSKTTELNAVVIDIKDESGKVGYESNVPEVKEIGAYQKRFNPDKTIKRLHENNIYVIGRIVCFKDPVLADKKQELAYKKNDGSVWRTVDGMAWVNPANKGSWDYLIKIANEGVDKGFDEIQYDYIRYVNRGDRGDISQINYGEGFDPATKSDYIVEFLRTARKVIHDERRVNLAADIFAISAVGTADDKILGQNWEKVCQEVDYVCPMAYPSHYALGQEIKGIKFAKPDLEPYNVVYQTLLRSKERLEKIEKKAKVRTYLQAFNASWLGSGNWKKYEVEDIRQQIKAVYDSGYDEWILWDSLNKYPDGAFEKK